MRSVQLIAKAGTALSSFQMQMTSAVKTGPRKGEFQAVFNLTKSAGLQDIFVPFSARLLLLTFHSHCFFILNWVRPVLPAFTATLRAPCFTPVSSQLRCPSLWDSTKFQVFAYCAV